MYTTRGYNRHSSLRSRVLRIPATSIPSSRASLQSSHQCNQYFHRPCKRSSAGFLTRPTLFERFSHQSFSVQTALLTFQLFHSQKHLPHWPGVSVCYSCHACRDNQMRDIGVRDEGSERHE